MQHVVKLSSPTSFTLFRMELFIHFFQISLEFVLKDSIDNMPALVQEMAWRWTCTKPLPGPVMIQFADVYIHHPASIF